MNNLQGKTALVTGGAKGIGLGIARKLDKAGAKVAIASLEKIEEIEKNLNGFSIPPEYFRADLSDTEQHQLLVGSLESQGLKVDILVNNAGIQFTSPVEAFPFEQWQKIININLSAAFYLTKLLLPDMQNKGYGRIINIASVHGLVASVNKAAYVAAKHGLVGLTKVIALENATRGITCNAICPGFVHTDLVEKQIVQRAQDNNISRDNAQKEILEEKQPSLDFVTTEQLGDLAVYLCSESASQITGTSLPIDGGWISR